MHAEDLYKAIYEQILGGILPPGEKLHIANLAKKFGVGLSPVREALSRLTATNLVIAKSNRGFIVTPLTLEDMNDIYTTRFHIEQIALTLSIEKGDFHWEANVVAAFHRLAQIEKEKRLNTIEEYKNWEKYNREYNCAIIDACGLKHLLSIQENLYFQTERYRRLRFAAALKKNSVLQSSIKEKPIMEAALARDAKKASELLKDHFEYAKKMIAALILKKEI